MSDLDTNVTRDIQRGKYTGFELSADLNSPAWLWVDARRTMMASAAISAANVVGKMALQYSPDGENWQDVPFLLAGIEVTEADVTSSTSLLLFEIAAAPAGHYRFRFDHTSDGAADTAELRWQ
jgi:hypothetical protein